MSNLRFEMFTIRQLFGADAPGRHRPEYCPRWAHEAQEAGGITAAGSSAGSIATRDGELATIFQRRPETQPAQCQSSLRDHEQRIAQWVAQGIQATTIHAALGHFAPGLCPGGGRAGGL